MAYTTIDDPTQFFEAFAYTGNGNQHVNYTSSFQPDWVWIKARGNTYDHQLHDSVRGVTAGYLDSATNVVEQSSYQLDSFDSDGITTDGSNITGVNGNTHTQVAWNWKAGTSFTNDASSTGVGSIDSSGSTSSDAGFSIISYTGTGSLGTIAHNLGAAPAWLIFKQRTQARDWMVYHHKNPESLPETDYFYLNTADAAVDADNFMNDTAPTSSVFTVKGFSEVNKNGYTYICYAFTEKKGYSKFGNYTGNGSTDGTFVYTGFKPAWVMTKRSNNSENWYIIDNKRSPFNPPLNALFANGDNVEDTNATGRIQDFLSNGFKLRTSDTAVNGSSDRYIYMAFAESPFVNSKSVPTNAR